VQQVLLWCALRTITVDGIQCREQWLNKLEQEKNKTVQTLLEHLRPSSASENNVEVARMNETKHHEEVYDAVSSKVVAETLDVSMLSKSVNDIEATKLPTKSDVVVATQNPDPSFGYRLKVEVLSGPHSPATHFVLPNGQTGGTTLNTCLVGRSNNKTMRTKGISLPKDLEVSTNHGKFEIVHDGNTIAFTDADSSNGTYLQEHRHSDDEKRLEPHQPCTIHSGNILHLGQTTLLLHVLDATSA
jgi:hypothetical protein